MAAKPKRITPVKLNEDQVMLLVDEAVRIDRQQRELDEAKKSIEDTLLTVAISRRKDDGEKTESGGWTVELIGNEGNVVAVTQAGPSMATLDEETFEAQPDIEDYYEMVVKYKPYKDALDRMTDNLSKDRIRQLRPIIQKNGSLRVAYKTKTAEVKPVGR